MRFMPGLRMRLGGGAVVRCSVVIVMSQLLDWIA
jgi:hypothetical protein